MPWTTTPFGHITSSITDPAFEPYITVITHNGEGVIEYTYTDPSTQCFNTVQMNVNLLPTEAVINGKKELCSGRIYQFGANVSGGVWASSNTSIVKVDVNGNVTSLNPGNATITYVVTLCDVVSKASFDVNVSVPPTILGPSFLPVGTTQQYTISSQNALITAVWSVVPNATGTTNAILVNTPAQTNIDCSIKAMSVGNFDVQYKIVGIHNNACANDAEDYTIAKTVTVLNCVGTNDCTNIIGDENIATEITNMQFENNAFCIKQNITIRGNVLFNDAAIAIDPDVSIVVEDNATLQIFGSHLYSNNANEMWKGVIVKGNGKIMVLGSIAGRSSLIEDAETAISYNGASRTAAPSGNIVLIDNSIFNRNKTGITISNYVDNNYTQTSVLPFKIGNSIFTSRVITSNACALIWPTEKDIKETPISVSTIYPNTPYISDVPYIDIYAEDEAQTSMPIVLYQDNTPQSCIKDGQGINKPSVGISINNVKGSYHSKIVIGNVGDVLNSNTTIFDNHQFGIISTSTNICVNNCTFQKMAAYGVGIYAGGGNCAVGTRNSTKCNTDFVVEVNTPQGTPSNAFFNNVTAVKISGVANANISNTCIRSTHSVQDPTDKRGSTGILFTGNNIEEVNINNNEISNVKNAIWCNSGLSLGDAYFNSFNIKNNFISKTFNGNPFKHSYMVNGIVVSAFVQDAGFSELPITIDKNEIWGVENGIQVSNWQGKNVAITNNNITVGKSITSPYTEHFGICLEGGYGSSYGSDDNNGTKADNQITGNEVSNNNGYLVSGILVKQQANTNIECNIVWGNEHGIRFYGNNPQTKLWNNGFMNGKSEGNIYGLTLDEGGIIGQQGDTKGMPCTSDNHWGWGASYYNGTTNKFMTNCISSDPTLSPLVVNPSFAFLNPNGAGTFDLSSPFPYQHTNNTLTNSIIYTQSHNSCVRCGNNTNYIKRTKDEDDKVLVQIALGTVNVPLDGADDRVYTMQQQLYELLKSKPTLLQGNTTLQQFILDNNWSSLDFIHYTAKYLAAGDVQTVGLLLGFWPGQEHLDDNYYQYFNWLRQMNEQPNWLPNANDVWLVASKCPVKNGAVVYAARNLYNAITGEINYFADDCNTGQARGMRNGMTKATQNQISKADNKLNIYPNPAHNTVNIVSSIAIKQIDILDLMGRLVISKNSVNNIAIQLNNLQLKTGVYVAKTTLSDNTTITKKLIIE